jgi:hypothetical protein
MFYNIISTKSPIISLAITFLCLGISFVFSIINPIVEGVFLFSPLVDSALFHLLVLLSGFYLNSIMINQKIVGLNNYSIVVLCSFMLTAINADATSLKFLFAFLILIHLSKKIILIFNTSDSTIPEFEMGLLSAFAFMVHPVFIFVFIYSVISMIISKANQWRDFMAILLGFLFGLSLKASYLLFTDQLKSIYDVFYLVKEFKQWDFNFSLLLVLQILLAGYAVYILNYYRTQADKLNVKIRVNYWTWAWMAVLYFVSVNIFNNPLNTKNLLLFSYLPIIIVSQLYFLKAKKDWINDVILLVLVLISIVIRF